MSARLRDYLDLVRLPNLFTAAADVMAGFLYAGGSASEWSSLLLLACASCALYAGGVTLNDVCDLHRDVQTRASRPIPSGRVSRQTAIGLTVVLLASGIALAASVSIPAAWMAALLVLTILLYDVFLKTTPIAPAMMGLCRALNLALGMSFEPVPATAAVLLPLGLMWLYVSSVTFFAGKEHGGGSPGRLLCGVVGVCGAVGGLTGLCWILPTPQVEYVALVGVLGFILGCAGLRAVRIPRPVEIQRAVAIFVSLIVLFDAALVWARCGPQAALVVSLMVVPVLLLKPFFRVT